MNLLSTITSRDRSRAWSLLTLVTLGLGLFGSNGQAAISCDRTLNASVVVFDMPLMWNRMGAQNINGMMYALRRDVIDLATGLPETAGGNLVAGNVALRPDKRPRPLVLRVSAGDCLTVRFNNLLAAQANPRNPIVERSGIPFNLNKNDQVAERFASFHVTGAQLLDSENDDGSWVGENTNSLVSVGGSRTYRLFFEKEGQYVINSYGATFGGEGQGGNTAGGLLGMVAVEPRYSAMYRSQVNRDEMNLMRYGRMAAGHPTLNYERRYPNAEPYLSEGKANLPVARIYCLAGRNDPLGNRMCLANEIVHSDINAIVGYGSTTGQLQAPVAGPHAGKLGHYPPSTYPLESVGRRNPSLPNRLEPFREFASVFHDEVVTAQAFPGWFQDPIMNFTLHGVRDSFMINYGSGGIGSEIIANRLGVGPMHDCAQCAYEEFFLASSTVGDPGLLVDVPANVGLEACDPALNNCAAVGPKANFALFPDDPANVHHSYTGDFVKFRNVHGGPAEQHIFHLHNHQWLFNPNDDNSNYLDAQGIGPGSGHTYEINLGGSGNRNKSSGDAIYHCHFYPHFAQGMWYLWRNHDVFEEGTVLQAQNTVNGRGLYTSFAVDGLGLGNATPRHQVLANGQIRTIPQSATNPGDRNRALPDGEILVGTPIPGLLPLPGRPMPPMPGRVRVVSKDAGSPLTPGVPDGIQDSSQAEVLDRTVNPGYPFWIAGIEQTVGQRAPTPPLDMITEKQAFDVTDSISPNFNPLFASHPGFEAAADGWDGGLPRFTTDGYLAGSMTLQAQTRMDFTKEVLAAKPFFFPETGTDIEQVVMAYHAQREHPSCLSDGTCDPAIDPASTTPVNFVLNGAPPVPGAPFNEPCIDDQGALLIDGFRGAFFSGESLTGLNVVGNSVFNAEKPRIYKGANVQFDAVFNKQGYHFPQQRIIALWQDVIPTINQERPPEPFVLRLNTFDCANYHHANLVPKVYELDDYQVRTPTDIIGQHIHLPKWDLTTADGAANGWNYEDGTLSPEAVVELIEAINAFNANPLNTPVTTDVAGNPVVDSRGHSLTGTGFLEPAPHPFFSPLDPGNPNGHAGNRWDGARTTTQRWFADPVVNVAGIDRGLGIIFTHDHYGPSTHQQVGLYATVLAEPAGSVWRHNETGVQLADTANGRIDGGPTSWQAAIVTSVDPLSNVGADSVEDFREFYLEHSDFQHAYEPGVYVGIGPGGLPITAHDINSPWGDVFVAENLPDVIGALNIRETFRFAQQPAIRQAVADILDIFPDNVQSPPDCSVIPAANGAIPPAPMRPCPEAITADDPGMFVVNYRNDSLLARIFNPKGIGPDGRPGAQTAGPAGDLGLALQSRTDRAIAVLNTPLGIAPTGYAGGSCAGGVFCPPITQSSALDGGDPFTPMLRAYAGDNVRIKIHAGGDEEEHVFSVHGMKWLQGGSGHGKSGNSGWRNSQTVGISEQFSLAMPASLAPGQRRNCTPGDPQIFGICLARTADYAYSSNASMTGYEFGTWGLLRNYTAARRDLFRLPDNRVPGILVANSLDFFTPGEGLSVCPRTATRVNYDISVALANDILPNPGPGVVLFDPVFQTTAGLHAGANTLDPNGGTLLYNSRPTPIPGASIPGEGGEPPTVLPPRQGPLHDPTAILYVHTADLGKDGKLLPTAAVEPVVIRAAAGDCIRVTLRNRLPADMPDLPTRTINALTVPRDRNQGTVLEGVHWFQTNHYRPSNLVGMHPQLVTYDMSRADGANVGKNPVSTVAPGQLRTYNWYAGDLEPNKTSRSPFVTLDATPVEFGGFGITSADKIKHPQKGLLGAGVVYPQGSAWAVDGGSHTAAIVKSPGGAFRDFTSIWQKGVNMYWGGDGDSVANTLSEGGGIAEDTYDSGQMAINYGTEPMWFRFGLNPDDTPGLNVVKAQLAYANTLVGGDPETSVFAAAPNEAFRLHVLEPAGQMRKSVPTLHGHVWQRDPYVCPGSADAGLGGKCSTAEVGSRALGDNPVGFSIGAFQSLMPTGHFEIVSSSAGGGKAVQADYLFRDHMGLGNLDGLWGILRVAAAVAAAPATAGGVLDVALALRGFVNTTPVRLSTEPALSAQPALTTGISTGPVLSTERAPTERVPTEPVLRNAPAL